MPSDVLQKIRSAGNTGLMNPTLAAVYDVGASGWNNFTNILSSGDASSSTTIASGTLTNYIVGFFKPTTDVPPGAKITGLEFEVARHSTVLVKDSGVRLIKDGNFVGDDISNTSNWPTSSGAVSYGGQNNAHGVSWTSEDLNSGRTGLAVRAIGVGSGNAIPEVDYIGATYYYDFDFKNGSILVDANPQTGSYKTTDYVVPTDMAISGVYYANLNTKFDDPRYYEGDTAS